MIGVLNEFKEGSYGQMKEELKIDRYIDITLISNWQNEISYKQAKNQQFKQLNKR